MIGKMMKVAAYRSAPRLTSAILHPGASARLDHMKYDLKHGYAPRISAVATALLAVPVGFMIGRVLTRRSARSSMREMEQRY